MNELTLQQLKDLRQLVQYQLSQNYQVLFYMIGRHFGEIRDWGNVPFPDHHEPVILKAPIETVELWATDGLIQLSQREAGGYTSTTYLTFLLRSSAFNFIDFYKKPKVIRGLINLWNRLIDDVPSLIWGTIGGALTVIITKILEKAIP